MEHPMDMAATILIVEDEPVLAEDLKEVVQDLGYIVCGCVDVGSKAIEYATLRQVDLVLMDIKLRGEMDGIETATILRERFDLPVVYLTAYSDDDIVQRAKVTEPLGFIVKPYRIGEIRSVIEIALYKNLIEKMLRNANTELEQKITERTGQLEEANAALKAVMQYRENEKIEAIRNFARNLSLLVLPHLDTIRIKCPHGELRELVDVIKSNLEKAVQPFARIVAEPLDLTPMEARVANLIDQGRGSKEIASLLGITPRGVTFHRQNIRMKMGIYKKKASLKQTLNQLMSEKRESAAQPAPHRPPL